jgi:hypothetical protein
MRKQNAIKTGHVQNFIQVIPYKTKKAGKIHPTLLHHNSLRKSNKLNETTYL